jgi:hypothetical protein
VDDIVVVELVEVLFVELVIKAELLVDADAVVVNVLFIDSVVEWTKIRQYLNHHLGSVTYKLKD